MPVLRRFALLTLALLYTGCATETGAPRSPRPSASSSAGPPPEFHVSPTGTPSGDGSLASPWDLATALSAPPAVTPGSIIWLHGGTYTGGNYYGGYGSALAGTAAAPIVVRQYPGEHAIVTNFLYIPGAYVWFWGFEVMNTNPQQAYVLGVNIRGTGTRLIHLVVHDASASGIYIANEAADAEVYGSIAYNNGRTNNLDHGIYCQSQTGTLLRANIVFDNWAYGIHCYASSASSGESLQHIQLMGNVAFDNYIWGVPWGADILVGGTVPASALIDRNYTYRSRFTNTMTADIGYDQVVNQDLVLTNNYFTGGWSRLGSWTAARVTGNTVFNYTTGGMLATLGSVSGETWSDNTFFGDPGIAGWRYGQTTTTFAGWLALSGLANVGGYAGSAPNDIKVIVLPSEYEAGRANIVVYNWAQQGSVPVDLSGVLSPGDRYVVHAVQDFYGAPVTAGTYDGTPIPIPSVSIVAPVPAGTSTGPAPVTGPTFNVFVVTRTP